jgi:hypothetical protein
VTHDQWRGLCGHLVGTVGYSLEYRGHGPDVATQQVYGRASFLDHDRYLLIKHLDGS